MHFDIGSYFESINTNFKDTSFLKNPLPENIPIDHNKGDFLVYNVEFGF